MLVYTEHKLTTLPSKQSQPDQGFLAGVLSGGAASVGVGTGGLGELSGLEGATLGGIPLVSVFSSPGDAFLDVMQPPQQDLPIRITA